MLTLVIALIVVAISLLIYYLNSVKIAPSSLEKKGFTILKKSDYNPDGKVLAVPDEQTTIYNHYTAKGLKHLVTVEKNKIFYVPLDIEIIKRILIKDFDHFMDRGSEIDENADPLSGHLFHIKGDRWRYWRTKLTPTFTTGKMKMMFPLLIKCANSLTDVLTEQTKKTDGVDIKQIVACFTTDSIASVAFGLESNSLKNPDEEFRAYGREYMSTVTRIDKLAPAWTYLLPKSIRYIFHPNREILTKITDFFIDLTRRTIDYREKNNVVRKDFLQMLIEIKNSGGVFSDNNSDDKVEEKTAMKNNNNIPINHLAAQCFAFYIGGFETAATTMTFASYELATHQDIQEKLRQNIWDSIQKHGGLTYEAIQDMDYLEQVINETLRMHPPLPILLRECNKEYKLPGTDMVLEKGTHVKIMSSAFHRDPSLYANPDEFDPEHFSKEAVKARQGASFLTFGEGPRICIGMRFGKLQTKLGLATLLKDFRIVLNKKTEYPLRYNPSVFFIQVNGGVYINLEKIN